MEPFGYVSAEELRGELDRTESERDFTDRVISEGERQGWSVFHLYDQAVYTRGGSLKHVKVSSKGWPDIVALRPPRIVVAELKSHSGKASDDQERWLALWQEYPFAEVFLWKPENWPEVEQTFE